LLRLPDRRPWNDRVWRNRRVEGLVSLADILPTACNALGLARSDLPTAFGQSLLPLVAGHGSGHAWLYHETLVPDLDYGLSELRGLQDERWKYIRAPRPELYDLDKDPRELTNLAAKDPDRRQGMEAMLVALLDTNEPTSAPVAMDQETITKLRSLGYVQGTRPDQVVRIDPKDKSGIAYEIARARTKAEAGGVRQAVAILDSLLVVRPEARMALRLRATYLLLLDRGPEALDAYAQALADCQGCPDAFNLQTEQARAFFQVGQTDKALAQVRDLLAIQPQAPGLHLLRGEILEQTGDADGARRAYARESELVPMNPRPLINLGRLEAAQGRPQPAEQAYRAALRVDEQSPEALSLLCQLLDSTGRSTEAETLVDQILTADPDNSVANYRKGFSLRKRGQPNAALPYLQTAVRGQPRNAELLFEFATLLDELGRKDQAKSTYQQAIATGTAPAGAYAVMGLIVGGEGDLQQAIRLWRQALTRNPSPREARVIQANINQAQEMLAARDGR